MDNSQSSDCFPESLTSSHVPMETISYESLVANTKQSLSAGITEKELKDVTISTYFTTLLEDCSTCINQSLDLVTGVILDTKVCIPKLTEYLNDAVCLLQLLSNFIKAIIESVSMACCTMKKFPSTTGLIIVNIFTHCKDSESLYGSNLGYVEKQLKDLFRNCHELQLTYLMILEKHFIFDLTDVEEKNILIEALDINLKIGEIVQSLDVKTMADQWKAYTMICEKYSMALSDTNIFRETTEVVCMLIRNNIKTAVEKNQDDKVILRSLKVASFTIKILLKVCNIFRHATRKDYSVVLDLLFYIYEVFHLETSSEKSQFMNLVLGPSECLLKDLLSDEIFGNSLLNYDIEIIQNEGTTVGFVCTIASAMKCLTQGLMNKTVTKSKLINNLYRILSHCHKWNPNLVLRSESNESHGIFEHLLIHMVAMAFTLDCEEYNLLEKFMIEAILATDCYSALFSSNLWVLISRHASPQLLFNQIIWLCNMFKKLENSKMFNRSPQKVHLSCFISKMFEAMVYDDKLKICRQFRLHDDDNISLWIALEINNLPEDVQRSAEEVVFEKLKNELHHFNVSKGPEGIDKLINVIKLAATCTFSNSKGIEDCILRAWSKTCMKHCFAIQNIDNSTVWFYEYVQALVYLTDSMWNRLAEKNDNIVKVLHWISNLLQRTRSIELRLMLINTLCKIATCDIQESKIVDSYFAEAFSRLFQDTEDIVRYKLYTVLREYKRDKNLDRILSKIEHYSVLEQWCDIKDGRDCTLLQCNFKAINSRYIHKCFENKNVELCSMSELEKASSSNFDMADIDDLFHNENDSDLEPLSKKVKLDSNETEAIVKRLEAAATLLCKMKENLFLDEYKNRIQNVCDKLKNIIN